ncbi:MAG: PKD domain-containing protein [Bacteroidales bacterium]
MGDIEVPSSEVLVLEPGVTVKIFSELSFKIYGKLLALGNETDSIYFIPIAEYWKGLQILNSPDTINLNYCSFKNFKNRINIGSAIKGGVIYGLNSNILISHSFLSNNQVVSSANINWAMGGAICLENCQGLLLNSYLLNNSIQNSSSYTLGGFLGRGGALYVAGCNYIVQGNQITQNSIELVNNMDCFSLSETYGGGIYVEGNNVWINDNIITGNNCISYAAGSGISYLCDGSGNAESYGGGIYGGNLKNNIIADNYCQSEGIGGGGSDVWGYGLAISRGGGVYDAVVIDNNIIKNNHCYATADGTDGASAKSSGGGVEEGFLNSNTIISNNIQALIGITGSIDLAGAGVNSCVAKNSIIYNNIGAIQVDNSSVTFSCIQGGYPGQGNISANPLFINGPQGNNYLKQYPCQSQQSPCLDTGDPNTNIFPGSTRTDHYPDLGIIDMGYHYPLQDSLFANFNVNENCGPIPFNVNFNNTTYTVQFDTLSFQWDFDNDGNVDSYEENPEWIYDEIGNYSVKLIVTGEDYLGGIHNDTMLIENYINVHYLETGFNQDTIYGNRPLTVQFSDTSYYVNTQIEQRQWDFENDSITDSEEENPTWTYNVPGLYSVKLIITDSCLSTNDTLIKEDLISVYGVLANFYAEPVYGESPLQVNFYDTSFTYMSEITQWQWDFENNGIIDSFQENPIWTYQEPGIYSIKLIAMDTVLDVSDTIIKENLITVCNLSPGFYAEPLMGYNPLEVSFYDTSITINIEIWTWKWDFQHDGIIDSWEQNPVWVFEEPGIYSVELRITDTSGQIWKSCVKEDYIEILTVGLESGIPSIKDPLNIYPNPFSNNIKISYYSFTKDEISILLLDNAFRTVSEISRNQMIQKGENSWNWNMQSEVEKGLYYVLISTQSNKCILRKCIKLD